MEMPVVGALTGSAYKCSNVIAGDLAGRVAMKGHMATMCATRYREEFQVEVAAMFKEISMTFSESSAFLGLYSVL